MIQTHEQLEAALESATRLLADRPVEGSASHAALMNLVQEIAAYRPHVVAPQEPDPQAPSNDVGDRLSRRLDAFEAEITPHYGPPWAPMVGGDVGPS